MEMDCPPACIRQVQIWLPIPLPLPSYLIYLSTNQMCRAYPINQSNCLKIGKR